MADDFLRWLGLVVIGTALIVTGWWMASGQGHLDDQVGPASLAAAGAIVTSVAHVLWILRGRRTVGERMERITNAPWIDSGGIDTGALLGGQSALPAAPRATLVAAPESQLFHRPSCPMVRGRAWLAAERTQHEMAGRRPCGLCAP